MADVPDGFVPFTGTLDQPQPSDNAGFVPFTGTLDPQTLVDPNTGQQYQPPLPNPGGRFAYGLRTPIDDAAVLATRLYNAAGGPGGQSALDWTQQGRQEALEEYKKLAGGTYPTYDPQRELGETATTGALAYAMPFSTSEAFLPRVASNVAGGAAASVLTGNPNAQPGEIIKNAAEGGTLGGVGGMIPAGGATALGGMAPPGSAQRAMMDIGVRPTPGQMAGGALNKAEQALTSVPLAGEMISAARRRAILQFNTGAINDALAPIGEMVEAPPGRGAIYEMRQKISDAYNNAVPTAGGTIDPQWQADWTDIQRRAQRLPADQQDQFNNIVTQSVQDRISPSGQMWGRDFKDADTELGQDAASYSRSDRPGEQNMGWLLRDTQTALRDWLARVSPANAAEISNANQAFARMLRIERAAYRANADPGVFSPAQLQNAAESMGRRGSTGPPLMQPMADAAREVLGATVPDSGTPLRLGVEGLAAAVAGHELPLKAALGGGAAVGGAGAIYNPYSQALLAHALATRSPWMQAAAPYVRSAAPVAAAGAGVEQGTLPLGLLGLQDRY